MSLITHNEDISILSKTFITVKAVMFIIPQLVVSQYDTSSQLLFTSTNVPSALNYILARLIVWDPVFFVKIAQRGYVFEQEWAFGWLWTGTIKVVGKFVILPIMSVIWPKLIAEQDNFDEVGNPVSTIYCYAIAAILIAHVGHYLSIVTFYFASRKIDQVIKRKRTTNNESSGSSKFALISALLFVISPGGIFLSSGYAETLFAFFSFAGIYFRESNEQYLLAGLCWFTCCCLRGNGILWGIVFVNDLYEKLLIRNWSKSLQIIIAGSLVGTGFLSGQVFAYLRYCPGRPWCHNTVPLIYGFVQGHYWNVGLFKYWRTWQIPNFLFALPTLTLFLRSIQAYRSIARLRPYVIIQGLMGVMALFVWHVQIITRVGTCMPLVYWYVAERVGQDDGLQPSGQVIKGWGPKSIFQRAKKDFQRHEGLWAVRYMITWILVQAVLFASFIPPA
ncbi:hypothetical protein V1514DRAFT_335517 [Lipomyces japonicus]|uniref:uncharacterized protein n=1 Tax=Lipomyces japonicus TaxID=56871 RepID=UPI0034CE1155